MFRTDRALTEPKITEKSPTLMAELLLAPSLQELQNAAKSGRLTDEQFCNFWRKAASQASLRNKRELLTRLLDLLDGSAARQSQWGRLLFHQYSGLLFLSEGQFSKANTELLAQRQMAWDLADATELALANLELAHSSLQIFHLEQAEGFLKDAAHWIGVGGEPALQVKLLNRRAELAGQQHLTTTSLKLARHALALARQYRFRLEQATAWHRIGINLMHHRDWEGSEQALRDCLRLRQTVRDQYGQAETLLSLANLQMRISQPDAALQSINAALSIMEKLANPFGIAQAIYLKAVLLYKNGQSQAALSWAIKTVEMRLRQGEPTRLAQSFSNLARIYAELGQTQQALISQLKVLELYRPAITNPQWVELLVEAGDYLLRQPPAQGDLQQYWHKSFEAYRTAIEIIEHHQNLFYLAPVLGRMARALLKLDGFDAIPEAIHCYELQLNLLGDIDSPTVPVEEAIAQRAEALTGLQVCASLLRRRQT